MERNTLVIPDHLRNQANLVDELRQENDRLRTELSAISGAVGSNEFTDPPDGGSVSLEEQVDRMRAELDRLRARVAEMEECREALSEARSNWEEASGEIWRLEGVLRVQLEALCAALPYVEDAGVRADIDRVRDAIAFDREQRGS